MWEQCELAGEDYSVVDEKPNAASRTQHRHTAAPRLRPHTCAPAASSAARIWTPSKQLGVRLKCFGCSLLGQLPVGLTDVRRIRVVDFSVLPWAAMYPEYRRCREETSRGSTDCGAPPKVRNRVLTERLWRRFINAYHAGRIGRC